MGLETTFIAQRDKLAEALRGIAVLRSTAWSPNDYVEAFCKARSVARAALAELDKENKGGS